MKKYIYPLAIAAALITTTACGDEEITNEAPQGSVDQKEIIAFTTNDAAAGSSLTRAGFNGGEATAKVNTQIAALFVSSDGTNLRHTRTILNAKYETTSTVGYSDVVYAQNTNARYWDDAFGRDAKISVYGIAVPNQPTGVTNNSQTLENILTLGSTDVSTTNTDWKQGDATTTISWKVTQGSATSTSVTGQDATSIANEDLCYTNNIQPTPTSGTPPTTEYVGKKGRRVWGTHGATSDYPDFVYESSSVLYPNCEDGPLSFALLNAGETTGPGHFDKGHMIFYHALTRLTINLKRGEGFSAGTSYFNFKTVGSTTTNVKLINVPYTGTLDLKTGIWTSPTSGDIESMRVLPNTSIKSGFDYALQAQFVPGYTFSSSATTTNALQFTIDDNTYYITNAMIYNALKENAGTGAGKNGLDADATSYEMLQGKNYVLDITVKKTGIQAITATLVPWVNVEAANIDATNSYISLSLMGPTSTTCSCFDLYRLNEENSDIYAPAPGTTGTTPALKSAWAGNYTDKADLTAPTSGNIWKTAWYWDNNKAFYHFRTVDKDIAIQGATGTSADATDDYINIYSGPVNDTWGTGSPATANISTAVNDLKYNDYHWGAPLLSTATALNYNLTTGYSDYISPAIGSTDGQINIIEQHMMSTVEFILHTGEKSDHTDAGAVSLLDASNKGTRLYLTNFVGNGTVKLGTGLVTPDAQTTSVISSDIPVPGSSYSSYTSGIVNTYVTTTSDYYTTAPTSSSDDAVSKGYEYRVVPQPLYRGNDAANDTQMSNFVGLTIVTPDNNEYYVVKKLYEVKPSTITSTHGKADHNTSTAITRWYPGYKYTYHIYINKKGIEAITCTIVDWVTVEGNVGDIDLES